MFRSSFRNNLDRGEGSVSLQPLLEPGQTIEKRQHLDTMFVPTAVAQIKQVHLGLWKINPETLQSPHVVRPKVVRHF